MSVIQHVCGGLGMELLLRRQGTCMTCIAVYKIILDKADKWPHYCLLLYDALLLINTLRFTPSYKKKSLQQSSKPHCTSVRAASIPCASSAQPFLLLLISPTLFCWPCDIVNYITHSYLDIHIRMLIKVYNLGVEQVIPDRFGQAHHSTETARKSPNNTSHGACPHH